MTLKAGETAPFEGLLITFEDYFIIKNELKDALAVPDPPLHNFSIPIARGARAPYEGILIESEDLQIILAERKRLAKRLQVCEKDVGDCAEGTSFVYGSGVGAAVISVIVIILALLF